jgi:CubicO group peptidase (beta-lactamase class C family)
MLGYGAPVRDASSLVDALFADEPRYGITYAAVVVRRDEVLAERYGGALPHFEGPDEPVGPDTRLISWSVAKSVLHAAVGVLVGEHRLELDAPPRVPEWSAVGDPRRAITLEHMLCMRDGLDFLEDYVDAQRSDVIEMLFGAGSHDVAHFAADRALAHVPGTVFNYSSGTSNIVARLVADQVGAGEATTEFLRDAVFGPIGMDSAIARLDDAGTFIGSSYVYATARDWVRFGQCYSRDGMSGGRRVIPEGWVEHGRRERSIDPVDRRPYGAHWWILRDAADAFYASGYEGQRVVVVPSLDLVIARFGRSTSDHYDALLHWCRHVVAACGPGSTVEPSRGWDTAERKT